MKKPFFIMGSVAVITLFAVGCTALTPKTHRDVDAEYEKFQNERLNLEYVETGDQSLDNATAACTKIYGATIKLLDEYVASTNNNRAYLGFMNEVKAKKETTKNLTDEDAFKMVLIEAQKLDEGKAPEQQEYPQIVAGYEAVKALNPVNKISELLQLGKETDTLIDNTKGLSSSFKGFDANTLKKVSSVKSVLKQAEFTGQAIRFLHANYQRNLDFEKFMK